MFLLLILKLHCLYMYLLYMFKTVKIVNVIAGVHVE